MTRDYRGFRAANHPSSLSQSERLKYFVQKASRVADTSSPQATAQRPKERRALPALHSGKDVHCQHYIQGKTCTASTTFRERRALPATLSGKDVHCQQLFQGKTCTASNSFRERCALPALHSGKDVLCKHYIQEKTCTASTTFRKRRALPALHSGKDVHCQHHFQVQYRFTDHARYPLLSDDGPLERKQHVGLTFRFSAAQTHNSHPFCLRHSRSLPAFKTGFKTRLFK